MEPEVWHEDMGVVGFLSRQSPSIRSSDADIGYRFAAGNRDGSWAFHENDGWTEAGLAALDYLENELKDVESAPAAWPHLFTLMEQVRAIRGSQDYKLCLRMHPIMNLLHEEPATFRSYSKPRGYSGDATLLDLLYEHPAAESELAKVSSVGRALHALVVSSSGAVAVRERRRLLGRLLDHTAERVHDAEVLVLACGHFREAQLARSLHALGRIVALDQDRTSIEEVCRSKPSNVALFPVEGSIGRMIVRPLVYGHFDLIYSAGLYDYLENATATALTQGTFRALKTGGRLLFANFCPGITDYGYMDAFMDWHLIPRAEEDMERLVAALPSSEIESCRIFRGLNRAIVYALVQKR